MTTALPIAPPSPMTTFSPITVNAPIVVPAPIEAVAWMELKGCSTNPSPSCLRRRERNRRAATAQRFAGGGERSNHVKPALAVAARSRTVVQPIDEVLAFDRQRLGCRHARDHDVAEAKRQGFAVGKIIRPLDAAVVNPYFLGRLHVVEDRHLAAADESELALLVRVEPAHVDRRHPTGR